MRLLALRVRMSVSEVPIALPDTTTRAHTHNEMHNRVTLHEALRAIAQHCEVHAACAW